MKTIDETIAFYTEQIRVCKEYAEECELCANRKIDKILHLDKVHNRDRKKCLEQIEEYEQLISWLLELKAYKADKNNKEK